MSRPPILLVHDFYAEDGGENQAFRLLARILEQRGVPHVQYTRDNGDLSRMGRLALGRAVPAGLHSSRTVREVRALVRRHRPALALVQNVFPLISPAVYRVLADEGVPVAQLVYNYRFLCPDAHLFTEGAICERCVTGSVANAVRHRCYRGSYALSAWYAGIVGWHRWRRTFAAIDRFLVPDHFMGDKLAAGGFPADRMRVVGNPYELPERPAPADDGFALFVGRLVPQKGILTLIRAVGRARSRPRLRVIGDGDLRATAERLAVQEAPGQVEFLGPRFGTELRSELARASFLCVPSEWYDNAPLVVYEAFAAAKPVIASRIDGLPEIVSDGADGLLAEPGSAEEWAHQIDALGTGVGRRTEMGRRGRDKAEREFSADAYYDRLFAAVAGLWPPPAAP